MPWGPKAGAPGNSNQFMPSGNGRDTFILSSPEFQHGRSQLAAHPFAYARDSAVCRRRKGCVGPSPPTGKRIDELHQGRKTSLGRARFPTTLALVLNRAESAPLPLTGASGTRSEAHQRCLPHVRERPLMGVNSGACFFSDPIGSTDHSGSLMGTVAGPGCF
mmetsp:Transcript_108078/g.315973  ORF Transcript_108078/g.315973 Transcript_108078/m.315973 type:complete len:162 (+) Transcript_108078:77-562(+)